MLKGKENLIIHLVSSKKQVHSSVASCLPHFVDVQLSKSVDHDYSKCLLDPIGSLVSTLFVSSSHFFKRKMVRL